MQLESISSLLCPLELVAGTKTDSMELELLLSGTAVQTSKYARYAFDDEDDVEYPDEDEEEYDDEDEDEDDEDDEDDYDDEDEEGQDED